MPYIKQEDRDKFSPWLDEVAPAESVGELNYQLSILIERYLSDKVKNYAAYNAIIGALECCKLEVYRRLVAPHEDKAIERNGDVF